MAWPWPKWLTLWVQFQRQETRLIHNVGDTCTQVTTMVIVVRVASLLDTAAVRHIPLNVHSLCFDSACWLVQRFSTSEELELEVSCFCLFFACLFSCCIHFK